MPHQHTLHDSVTLQGIGLHRGCPVSLTCHPAPADHGIVFVRSDLPGRPHLQANIAHVVDTRLATTLGVHTPHGQATVATVEHLLAALYACDIDNARIEIDGPEVPALDGSATLWMQALERAGRVMQPQARAYYRVRTPVRVQDGSKSAALTPSDSLHVVCSLHYDHPVIGRAAITHQVTRERFARDIAPARTFGFFAEVESMKAQGLALGGSFDNAVVIGDDGVLNPGGLRYDDECIRHKVLDGLGDLSLIGLPVLGTLTLHASGHTLHAALVRAALSQPGCLERVSGATARQDLLAGAPVNARQAR
jgi:UDP-3-O-[3-hydroxymyristoyl] N-acetylglucosamine deacetylase